MTDTDIQYPTAIFDESNKNYSNTQQYNLLFIRQTQNYLNDVLATRGHVLLNDAFDALGLPRTPDGCISGWLLSRGNFIDFGLFAPGSPRQHPSKVKLEFNVDGIIYTEI